MIACGDDKHKCALSFVIIPATCDVESNYSMRRTFEHKSELLFFKL